MLIVSRPENLSQIEKIFNKWDLEYNVIGSVTEKGSYNVYKNDNLVYHENHPTKFLW